MQPLEKHADMDDAPKDVQDAVSQLSFAYQRGADALTGDADEALTEGIRRAEAILFAAGEPLSAKQISEVLPQGVEASSVLMALRALYAPRGVTLVEVAGKWRFQTAQDLAFLFVEEKQVQKKLGQAALETLAIIAYGQPVTRAEVEAVRGVAVSKTTIDTLLETGWVKTAGQRQTPGLPMEYKTTPQFLEHFGLESLSTLPGKADLEAEGLLSDKIPEGLMMPDEEALSEDETMIEDSAEDEEMTDAFVTDFMEESADDEDVDAHSGELHVEADEEIDEAFEGDVDMPVVSDDSPFVSATAEVELISALEADASEVASNIHVFEPAPTAEIDAFEEDDGFDPDEGVSVFAYTREADASEADAATVSPADELDEMAVEAAVIRLRGEAREPQRPMSDWTDED